MANSIKPNQCVPNASRECCRTPGNVPLILTHPDARPPHCFVRVCKVCGARHFELLAPPGTIGLRSPGLGV